MNSSDMNSLETAFLEAFGLDALPDIGVRFPDPIAVILAYNEALRLPYFLAHHRALGIKHFVVIDNNSSDGSDEYLDAQPDVTRIFTTKPYRENKSVWRQTLCDLYFGDRWVYFPDVDELLVYPGWPDIKIDQLLAYLDENHYGGLFTTMVDMYPKGSLAELKYEKGTSFINSCPYFDSAGYRFVPLKGANGRSFSVPTRHVYGGTRERLFHHISKRKETFLDRIILKTCFSITSKAPQSALGRWVDRKLFKLVKNSLPGVDPLMSKIPLVKWKPGISFSGGVHSLSGNVALAPDWGALLHFKYLSDFEDKVVEAIDRKQHAVASRFYRDYEPHLTSVMQHGAMASNSEEFVGDSSLLDCGLMRKSSGLRAFIGRN